jgi:hypothetical protein
MRSTGMYPCLRHEENLGGRTGYPENHWDSFFVSDAPSWRGSLMVLVRGEWPAHWEPQEEGVMSIAAGFPSVKKPRYVDLGEERQTTKGDAC